VLTPELLALVPQFFSTDTETTVAGLSGLLRLAFLRAHCRRPVPDAGVRRHDTAARLRAFCAALPQAADSVALA